MKQFKCLVLMMFFSTILRADDIEPPKLGNFALPSSQQPSGLFAFGGNVIDKGQIQTFIFEDAFIGSKKRVIDTIPSFLYGITDELSILFNFPFTPLMSNNCFKSRGLEDFYIQGEYAFYNKKTTAYINQATVVGNVTGPTGSFKKNPNTGYGAPSFFLGATFYHMRVDWFFFTGQGVLLPLDKKGNKIGDQFLYQFGFGRSLPSPDGWIFAWMLEADGQYSKKNTVHRRFDPNTGGHILYATPSLWISSKDVLFQFGFSLPLTQHFFGNQRKFNYALNFNIGWSFYRQ